MRLLSRTRLVAAVVTLVVVFGCAPSSDANQRDIENSQNEADRVQPPGAPPTPAPDQSTTPNNEQQTTGRRWEQFKDRLADPVTLFTGGLLWLAILQYRAMRRQADYVRDGLNETRASIAEATRSAKAMEDIAASMATSVQSVKDSIVISREIADTQKLVTVIQHRAHMHVTDWKVFRVIDEFPDALTSDRSCMIRFFIKNRGASKAWLKGMNASVPSVGYERSPAIDMYLDPDEWVEQRLTFTLPTDSDAADAILGRPLVVNLDVYYSDGFASRTKQFSRATFSHTDALTTGTKPAEQWWYVHGGTAMNGETEEGDKAKDVE